MTSVERILEYCELEAEAPPITEKRPPSDWPPSGSIIFKGMSLKYASHLKNVLHRISCHVRPNEKVINCHSVVNYVHKRITIQHSFAPRFISTDDTADLVQ